jgi:hypothetical protein
LPEVGVYYVHRKLKGTVVILNSAPSNEAVLSNVGTVNSFSIKATAKSFSILSSGLYANKIKAIIRELSCNAIDSHKAAGKEDVPFEVHLPTTLEPYFSVRDFGTGLTHDQVTNIFTTFFESTKTDSNDFIGALGLGSKSPFSYTDNFTVTAIRDGIKGIYTAFINEIGVPSIALMTSEESTEPNGVEIKFSVNDRYDFSRFESESYSVFKYFKQIPTFKGNEISISKPEYETENIVPGVHVLKYANKSYALMGNICYPIELSDSMRVDFGDLYEMLTCGLTMEFGIGELDFQASREGLSYIPLTLNSIKTKLEQVRDALSTELAKAADAIECGWERSQFLYEKRRMKLWTASVTQYATDTNFNLYDVDARYYDSSFTMKVLEDKLKEFNIVMRNISVNGNKCSTMRPERGYFGLEDAGGNPLHQTFFGVDVTKNTHFVVNDTNVGASERMKQHYRTNNWDDGLFQRDMFLLEKIDKKADMDLDGFFEYVQAPPEKQRILVSSLDEKERKESSGGVAKNVNILTLKERAAGGYYRSKDLVWREAGSLDSFDANKKHYYVPLSGFKPQLEKSTWSDLPSMVKTARETKLGDLMVPVYGIRKADLEAIQAKSNWVLYEDHIFSVLSNVLPKIDMANVMNSLDMHPILRYNSQNILKGITNALSPAKTFLEEFNGLPSTDGIYSFNELMRSFKLVSQTDITSLVTKYNDKLKDFSTAYPLLDKMAQMRHYFYEDDVVHYINTIDQAKGI